MVKRSFDFSNLFSSTGQAVEDRKEKIERRKEKVKLNEEFYTGGRPEWIVDLYLELDRFIIGLKSQVRKEFLESYIKYSYNGILFAYILISKKENLKVWAKVPYASLGAIPLFVRDYEPVSRRVGVMVTFDNQREFSQGKEAMLEVTFGIIKKALQGVVERKRKVKTPLKPTAEVKVVKMTETFKPSLNLVVDDNGYIDVHFKIKKSQRGLLSRILSETILK